MFFFLLNIIIFVLGVLNLNRLRTVEEIHLLKKDGKEQTQQEATVTTLLTVFVSINTRGMCFHDSSHQFIQQKLQRRSRSLFSVTNPPSHRPGARTSRRREHSHATS